ncbi:FtsK/SpoIIIE domain-containing protein, partial [Xanthomonas citri pv. citri]
MKIYIESYYDNDLNKDLVKFNMKYRYDQLFIIDPVKLFNQAFENQYKNSFQSIVGMNNYNQSVIADFKTRPNILISGQTGRGKSNIGNQLLLSLMGQYSKEELDIIIFDETKVEFYVYKLSDYVSHHIIEYE